MIAPATVSYGPSGSSRAGRVGEVVEVEQAVDLEVATAQLDRLVAGRRRTRRGCRRRAPRSGPRGSRCRRCRRTRRRRRRGGRRCGASPTSPAAPAWSPAPSRPRGPGRRASARAAARPPAGRGRGRGRSRSTSSCEPRTTGNRLCGESWASRIAWATVQAGVEELDLGARHHDLADLALAGLEDVVDELALVAAQRLVAGHQVAQLGLADRARGRAFGSPPSSRTTTSVDTDSSQITGRISAGEPVEGRRDRPAVASARCSAIRFGASSPTTSVT